jgi:single-stranded-DNA-specific exonuclease
MAAGFTIETQKIVLLQETLEKLADSMLAEDMLIKNLTIDCEIPLSLVTTALYKRIQELSPFGMGNPEPIFVSTGVTVANTRILGKEANHLKLSVYQDDKFFDAIAFNQADRAGGLKIGTKVDLAYTIDENHWNGSSKIQLKVKDIKIR